MIYDINTKATRASLGRLPPPEPTWEAGGRIGKEELMLFYQIRNAV